MRTPYLASVLSCGWGKYISKSVFGWSMIVYLGKVQLWFYYNIEFVKF